MDTFDEQYAVLCLDLANDLDLIAFGIHLDLTYLQRAGEWRPRRREGKRPLPTPISGVSQLQTLPFFSFLLFLPADLALALIAIVFALPIFRS